MCQFNKDLKTELTEALGLTEEQLEILDETKFDELLTEAIKKNLDQSESQTQTENEKEIEMNNVAIETPVVETAVETTTSTALAKVKSPAARKAISVFAKIAAGVLFGGACAVAGATHHKEVNKAVKKARKKVGKYIPAVAPKPWYKF
ncbi:hypothetical protein [Neisseria sp. P0024.S002]|uniref:hypothetical protein n=1 Tax=Neisseria sp. P0024.S002 TaxID=3436846 RepID=UPI003F7E694B